MGYNETAPFGCRKSSEDSHKLIPDAETAPIVRRMCKEKREPSIFSGIAYCSDCGRRILFFPERTSKNNPEKTYFGLCQNYKANGPDGCTPHRIREQDLYDTVLKEITSCIINELITKI